ncbi:MAG: polysaccharide pyruvyl transferase family protein, partial [Opitutaceae bacterium]|nr:polysaccharide pyruvyl transferase family protein [Opitutaceae bacterium]
KDGYATAVFWVQDAEGAPYEEGRLPRLKQMIGRTFRGEVVAREALKDRDRLKKREREFRFPTAVTFDNEGSDIYTIIEVDTRDRPGLLYDLTRTLAANNIYIASAMIATYGVQVVDSFYVKDMFGLKLDYRQFVHALVSALLAHTEAKILLIPHVFAPIGDVESDLQICHIVRDQLSADHAKRVTVLEGTYDQHEVKWVIGRCDFVIGSRMHACIAALSQHVPCIGVAYSMKFEGVFESVGATDCVIDGRTISSDDAVQRIISAYNRREQIGSALKTSVATAKAQLRTVFSEVMRNI